MLINIGRDECEKMRLNSKFATILIYLNATWRGRKRSDFILFFERCRMQQNKEKINFKTKRVARVLGEITHM